MSVISGVTYAFSVAVSATQNPDAVASGSVAGGTSTVSSTGPKSSAEAAGNSASSAPTSAVTASKKSSSVGAIVGGVVSGVVVIALLAGLIFFLLKKKRTTAQHPKMEYSKIMPDSWVASPDPKELYAPANTDKWSDGSVSELHVPSQYHPQQSELNMMGAL